MSIRAPLTRRHVTFRGKVQGVGFRWFVKESAEALGLVGWVRNLADGSVESEVQGPEGAVDRFLENVRTGNPYARVDDMTAEPVPAADDKTFKII
jgi:acylphosphatase